MDLQCELDVARRDADRQRQVAQRLRALLEFQAFWFMEQVEQLRAELEELRPHGVFLNHSSLSPVAIDAAGTAAR